MPITFTPTETAALAKNPDALRVLANEHDCWEVGADARGFEAIGKNHKTRARELRDAADKIEADY